MTGKTLTNITRKLPHTFPRSMSSASSQPIHFGPFEVTQQVFFKSTNCYALVNIKPILPGHVLVIPYRPVPRMTDLSSEEVCDVFTTVQKVQRMLGGVYFNLPGSARSVPWEQDSSADANQTDVQEAKVDEGGGELEGDSIGEGGFTVTVQDGEMAGQTVKHMHCHIIPRRMEDAIKGDEMDDVLQGERGNIGGGFWDTVEAEGRPVQKGKFPQIGERMARSKDDMNREAAFYRARMGKAE